MQSNNLPPISQISPLAWIQKNLFSTWYNGILTVLSLLFLGGIGSRFVNWTFTQAQWGVIGSNLQLLLVGQYPVELLWRAWTTLGIIIGLGGLSWGILAHGTQLWNRKTLTILGILSLICALVASIGIMSSLLFLGMLILLVVAAVGGQRLGRGFPGLGSWLGLIWLLTFFVLLWLLEGGLFLRPVRLDDLGGLILTILTATVSITLSFPFGVLLALGRQSSLPVVRWLAIAYIEVIRGLPLIGILFMAQVMLPLILPEGLRLDRVVRAIAGFTLFSAAYLAEGVRGGLQSIPKGQTEAAKALGLNTFWVVIFIILPQALKAVIPIIVGQFISLFKDTSLLAIVGLVDLLGISQSILANPKFLGHYGEVYLFIALIYWFFCYSMSLASRQLEKRLRVVGED